MIGHDSVSCLSHLFCDSSSNSATFHNINLLVDWKCGMACGTGNYRASVMVKDVFPRY